MMLAPKRKNVRQIHNEFIQQQEQLEKEAARRKRGIIRRVIALTFVFTIFAFISIMSIQAQNDTLVGKNEQKEQLEQQLSALVKEESQLKQDIEALNDLDYIAEIARRDYYLTKEGEILFKIPKSTTH